MFRWFVVAMLAACMAWRTTAAAPAAPSDASRKRPGRPVAAAWLDAGRILAIANRQRGAITLLDAQAKDVLEEFTVGARLSDLAVLPNGRHLLAADEARHQLVLLAWEAGALSVRVRLPVASHPVRVAVTGDGTRCLVASLWSRRLSIVELDGAQSGALASKGMRSVELPFPPREILALANGDVLVADAFGGELAVVDSATGAVAARHVLPVHSIRGLALSVDGRHVLMACQILDESAPTTWDTIDLGRLMRSEVWEIAVDELQDSHSELTQSSHIVAIGSIGRGAADPESIAALDDGRWLVTLGGVDEAALGSRDGVEARFAVGARPTAAVVSPDGRQAFVLNTHADSVSIVDTGRGAIVDEIALGSVSAPGPVERGERLFYDARLSHDGWMSCHSCHTDGHTIDRLVDTLGDGGYGAPKRILSLLGTGHTDPWAWNGQMKELHTQVEQSVESTMRGPRVTSTQVSDLVAYLHTLAPAPPVAPMAISEDDALSLERGRVLFERRGCVQCHVPPLTYTGHGAFDVGLADERGETKFNPPSLRGVSQRRRFFHDGRAGNLEEVFTDHGHQLDESLPEQDLADLVRFLRSL